MIRRWATLVKEGVYRYTGQRHLKPFGELAEAIVKKTELPVTLEHPDAGIVTDKTPTYGKVDHFKINQGERTLEGIVTIDDEKLAAAGHVAEAQALRANKMKGVSLGFWYNHDPAKGEWKGQGYDVVQKDYDLNHLALTEAPRVPQAALHFNLDSRRAFAYDAVMLGLDPMHPSWRSLWTALISQYGQVKGKNVFYAMLNKYGWDETKPRPKKLRKVKVKDSEKSKHDNEAIIKIVAEVPLDVYAE